MSDIITGTHKQPRTGQCFRCEHRARWFETGVAPRDECGTPNTATHGCYMYQPVRPVIQAPAKGDRRPRFAGGMIAARERFAGVVDEKGWKLQAWVKNKKRREVVLYWVPRNKT